MPSNDSQKTAGDRHYGVGSGQGKEGNPLESSVRPEPAAALQKKDILAARFGI